jgi:uncharacterized protein (TIGR03000 family)
MSRIFGFGATLACALALVGAPSARAQHGHGGHGGHVSAAHVGGGHVGYAHYGNYGYGHGYYGHGYYGHGHGGFALSVGLGLGYGYGGYGYGGLGYAYPDYYPYAYPAVYSSYPAYSVGYSYAPAVITGPATVVASDPPPVSSTVIPAQPATGEGQVLRPNAASMEVHLPDANAEVLVDGRPTRARGQTRTLVSPELPPGKAYVYKLTASWTQDGQRVSEERTVEVTAGKTSLVDFTHPAGADDLPFPKERVPAKPPLEPK